MKKSDKKNIFIGRRIFLFILLLSADLVFAQKEFLERFPEDQHFYVGGKTFLMKEMVNIVKEKGLSPCANSNENYIQKLLIYEDGRAVFVKDEDTANIQANRCAYEFGRKVLSNVPKKWLPAKENGKMISAIAYVEISPFYLYNSKPNPKDNIYTFPKLKKGNYYNNEVSRIMSSHIHKNESKQSSLSFIVNELGDIEDVKIFGDYTDLQKRDISRDVMKIKGQWIPATYNNIPIKYLVRQKFSQEFDFESARNLQ